MSWIKEIKYEESDKVLRQLYDRVKGPNNNIDNILSVHSLRPHSLLGHMNLYKNVLHNANNTLPKWYLETLGVYVSYLNECSYCVEHHFEGLRRLVNDEVKSSKIMECVQSDQMEKCLEEKYAEGASYAKKLTLFNSPINESDILSLRRTGLDDGEILEINQVVSYFNYANRTVLGLGVNTKGDILGLSPNDSNDSANWSHS
ncbi:MAG: peroxidase-related enzyme [Cyclobacteriaceae bacterium]